MSGGRVKSKTASARDTSRKKAKKGDDAVDCSEVIESILYDTDVKVFGEAKANRLRDKRRKDVCGGL